MGGPVAFRARKSCSEVREHGMHRLPVAASTTCELEPPHLMVEVEEHVWDLVGQASVHASFAAAAT